MARPLTSREPRTRAELAGHLNLCGLLRAVPGLSGAVRGSPREKQRGEEGVASCEQKSPPYTPRGEGDGRGVGEVSHSEKKRETVQTRAERSAESKGCSDGENLTGVQLVPLPVSPS